MENLIIPIIKQQKAKELHEFISYWSSFYDYPNDSLYNGCIWKSQFERNDILNLYVWKNGMRLSKQKQLSLEEKVLPKLILINKLKEEGSLDLNFFFNEFKSVSSVWKIFLLHIIKPNQFPIYDQHIHRAFLFIQGLDYSKISNDTISEKEKLVFYQESYLPYIKENNVTDLKKQDEAFFAFGQFLKTRNYEKFFV